MTLDALVREIRVRGLVLISEQEVWPSPLYSCKLQRAVKKHRQGLRLLLHDSATSVCASSWWHRSRWNYSGNGRFTCEVCQRQLLSEVS